LDADFDFRLVGLHRDAGRNHDGAVPTGKALLPDTAIAPNGTVYAVYDRDLDTETGDAKEMQIVINQADPQVDADVNVIPREGDFPHMYDAPDAQLPYISGWYFRVNEAQPPDQRPPAGSRNPTAFVIAVGDPPSRDAVLAKSPTYDTHPLCTMLLEVHAVEPVKLRVQVRISGHDWSPAVSDETFVNGDDCTGSPIDGIRMWFVGTKDAKNVDRELEIVLTDPATGNSGVRELTEGDRHNIKALSIHVQRKLKTK